LQKLWDQYGRAEQYAVVDSLQLTAEHKVGTPVNWQQGGDVIIAGAAAEVAAQEIQVNQFERCRRVSSDS